MSAITQPNVRVTTAGWTELSSADIQTLQVLDGVAGVIFADIQPESTVQVGSIGHTLYAGPNGFLNNGSGGTSWGRAETTSGTARFGVTEG